MFTRIPTPHHRNFQPLIFPIGSQPSPSPLTFPGTARFSSDSQPQYKHPRHLDIAHDALYASGRPSTRSCGPVQLTSEFIDVGSERVLRALPGWRRPAPWGSEWAIECIGLLSGGHQVKRHFKAEYTPSPDGRKIQLKSPRLHACRGQV